MNIKGKIVTLRAIEKDDLDFLKEMINDPEMENYVVGWSFPVSSTQQESWYSNIYNSNSNLRLIIETELDGRVGLISLTNIDWKNRSAIHGIKLSSKQRSRGIGTDAVKAIIKYAFEELQLNRIEASWIASNVASEKLHLKLGWKKEGTMRQCIFKNGKYHDLEIAGLLCEDYWDKCN